jgi:uncharacterized protein (DUF1800 family)
MAILWNREAAAHLARRAGFGATPAELDQYVAQGLERTVDGFVEYDGIDNNALESDLLRLTSIQPPATAPAYDLTRTQGIQKWFLHRMAFTRRPLEEKMTYFWNLLFTSGVAKVDDSTLMLNQNKTERALAVGKFDDLVLAITKDPAMMIWLDNRTNRAGRPNENYARELMELFTLGEGNYTEADVREVARSLTGWTITKPRESPASAYAFYFDPTGHDNGPKMILGQIGNWDGADAIRIILNHADSRGSVSGRWLARLLWTFFVYPDPPEWAVDELASVYLSSGRSVKAMLHVLFRMPEFYETHSRRAIVRGPVEYMVAAIRNLEAKSDFQTPVNSLIPMGQYLFNPEDARGWEGDLSWINTGTVFSRATFANALATNRSGRGSFIEPSALVAGRPLATASDVVNALADRLGLLETSARSRAVWESYVVARDDGSRGTWTNTPQNVDRKVRGLVHLMLTSPEYQLA